MNAESETKGDEDDDHPNEVRGDLGQKDFIKVENIGGEGVERQSKIHLESLLV